ncbi:MAG: glycosyltransferase [Hydrococcus sp. C42_A2020_068]|uniref:glycosyltransferase n=1 Tax=Pleurocapsa sp. PCC 7327 TaxID=118163 RepID=UPI00029FAEFF|nr:glycosyltransferase [Pleurocapsa sp. PCC 7327]AFY78992.1 glycosyl transferase [Pleurocapsa sp. PCC 7327]MBF2021399.1 glycosyltransferase [Hydrococcus sp. C42_A2020_068]
MKKQQISLRQQITPQDWEKTPASVKMLVEEIVGNLKLLDSQLDELSTQERSHQAEFHQKRKLVVVIPSFNDWQPLEKLLLLIDEIILAQAIEIEILIVDDYSTQPIPESLICQQYRQIRKVNVLRLRRNLGHQRAIAIGLSYLYHNINCDLVVVMDGDGEDSPLAINRLLSVSDDTGNNKIIFARRSQRSEGNTFKFFYWIYKTVYRLLIGREINVGNFSLLPASLLKNIVAISEIWNHYSSGIYRSRLPYLEVNIPRARRLAGKPKMNLVSLVTHGLSSIAVYGDVVGTRILLSIIVLLILFLIVLCLVFLVKFLTKWAIPGWATYVSGLLVVSLLQLVILGTVFSMIILSTRNNLGFIPMRDYKYYVEECFQLKP